VRKNLFKGIVFGAVAVSAAVFTGCLTGGNESASGDATLRISMGLKDVRKDGGLAKSQTISLSKLVVTLTSNATVPDVINDTIVPGQNGFSSNATIDQVVNKTYNIKPLRNWTVTVKTIDAKDSVIHEDETTALNVKVGEEREIELTLDSKFVMYFANFVLPDSLRASGTSQTQKLYVNRLMMVVDGDTVVDSTRTYFAAGAPGHSLSFDYVKAGVTHDVALFVFADSLDGWDPNLPVFGDTVTVQPTDTAITPSLPWTGPGSPSDPNYDPSNPGGAVGELKLNINKVKSVVIQPGIDSTVFKRK
jgi:hypothetical protein